MMADMMTFPNTVEEFMEQYKIVDDEKVYTNGADLVPIFRMKQWFEHISATDKNVGTTDTISRQAAIDVLDAYQVKIENGEENPYAWARLRMSELPSVTPEQQWIPVTERLPEKSTDVLICNSVGTIKIRSLESSYDGMWYWESSEGEYEGLSEAIAWMPLPKCKGDAE